jgi:transcriptional regulator with XRE-family HTH domain
LAVTLKYGTRSDGRFGERIAFCRQRMGWSQSELSRQCEGDPTSHTISSWERGTHEPNLGPKLTRVADVLRVTPGWLLYGKKGDDLDAYD